MDDGSLSDARVALDEAGLLDPRSRELASLEDRFRELSALSVPSGEPGGLSVSTDLSDSDANAVDDTQPDPQVSEMAGPFERPSRRWLVAAAAGAIVLVGGVAFGSLYWRSAAVPAPVAAAEPPVAGAAVSTAGLAPSTAATSGLRVIQETVKAPMATPELISDEPTLPSFPAPPIAPPDAAPQPAPVVLATNRGEPTPSIVLPETPRGEVRFDALATAPPPEPPTKPVSNVSSPIGTPLERPTDELPAARAEPKPADDSSVVRGVLARYERAYNSLDAGAASEVWPGVDRSALARAFDGLESQRVSLKACDVTVTGPAARAVCSGTAMWVPKIGGGAKTAARRWNFELRKHGEDWQIERAIAR
jgi:hypothetical protein